MGAVRASAAQAGPPLTSSSRHLTPRESWGPTPRLGLGRSVREAAPCPLAAAARPASNSALRPGASCSGVGSGPCLPWPFCAGQTAVRVLPRPAFPALGGSGSGTRASGAGSCCGPGPSGEKPGTCARPSLGILLPRLHKRSEGYSACITYRSRVLMAARDVRSG